MKLAELLVELRVMGCQVLSADPEIETFQDVEFRISQTTDLRTLIQMLRRYSFYNIRIDTKDEDVFIATRFVYPEDLNFE